MIERRGARLRAAHAPVGRKVDDVLRSRIGHCSHVQGRRVAGSLEPGGHDPPEVKRLASTSEVPRARSKRLWPASSWSDRPASVRLPCRPVRCLPKPRRSSPNGKAPEPAEARRARCSGLAWSRRTARPSLRGRHDGDVVAGAPSTTSSVPSDGPRPMSRRTPKTEHVDLRRCR